MQFKNLHKCAYAFSHGVDKDRLGLAPLYYGLAYANKSKTIVVAGSGGGLVPMVLRQAQRDLGFAEFETYLIDGFCVEAGYGHPEETGGWALEGSILKVEYPDIHIIKKLTKECTGMFASIDFLHIDAEHTYEAVLADFGYFKDALNDTAIVSFHDTMADGVQKAVNEIASVYNFEVLNLRDMASGLSVLRRSTKDGYQKNLYDDCQSRPKNHRWVMEPVDLDSIDDLK